MRVCSFAVLIVLLISVSLPAQEGAEQADEPGDSSSLFDETLPQDIATSGFFELVTWNELLGLSTRGNRTALAERLYLYYGIPEDDRPAEEEDTEPPIVIDSASRTSYFTLEESDERYIRLTGGVVVTLRDDEQDAVHRITADEVVFNQDRNTVAASGSVVYVLERDGTTEQFSGEAMTVELGEWEGAFVQGVSERERTIEGEAIDFAFTGTYITRSSDDVIVLDDGRITSSEADPPNYEIRARKIWVLAPGEWGLQNAVLYIGRVPVFYFPFFFRPGNRLFVNPSLGTRDREGAYIQTTVYLRGEPEAPTSPFSLLQLANDGETSSTTRREGLYLVPDTENLDPEEGNDTIRLITDLYTKLGAFAAVEGELASLGALENVAFEAGLAATRHIYVTNFDNAGAAYTPYYIDDGSAVQSWNVTQLGSISLPVRFGITFRGTLQREQLSSTASFEVYSDSRYRQDFGSRAEQIDWLGLVGQGETVSSPSAISSMLWQLSGSYTADTSEAERIQSLSIQRVLASMQWRNRTVDATLLGPETSAAYAERIQTVVAAADSSPEASFFYPDSFRLPEIAASMSGTILEFPASSTSDSAATPTGDLIPPWTTVTEQGQEPSAVPLTIAPLLAELPSPSLPDGPSLTVRYTLSPSLIVDQFFLDESWNTPEDVDFQIAYGGASARLGSSLAYNATVANRALRLSGTLTGTGQYREVFNRNDDLPDTEWTALENQAFSFTSVSISNTLTGQWFPIESSDRFGESNLSYTLGTLLYRLQLDEVSGGEPTYDNDFVEWDEEFIRQHQVGFNTVADLSGRYTLSVTTLLPPFDPDLAAAIGTTVGFVTASASSGLNEANDEWTFDPFSASITLRFADQYSNTTSLLYDIEDEEVDFLRTGFSLGTGSVDFEARTTENAEFGGPGVGWQDGDERRLRPYSASAGYRLARELGPFWRNRVVGSIDANVGVSSNLIRYTESSLQLGLSATLVVHKFLALGLSVSSSNDQMYVYVPSLAEGVGREPRNIALDLLQSFNFFSRSAREESGFNVNQIRFSLLHDLGDWDLTLGYAGAPELITATDGTRSFEWQGELSINVQWRPIGELSTDVNINSDEILFGADS